MRALVNKIIPFSSVDGPGNRTVIFLQGCNINCKYCHNPETKKICNNCGLCVQNCPTKALSFIDNKVSWDKNKCIDCDLCIHNCPIDASPKVNLMHVNEIIEIIKNNMPFVRGITVSGGECMLQANFIELLFTEAKELKLTTLIDSNGTIPFWNMNKLMSVCDGVMLDMKAYYNKDHINITDYPNDNVIKNAKWLAINNKLFEVRFVIVPDLYNAEENIKASIKYLKPLYKINKFRIKIIAFRPFGVKPEYKSLSIPNTELLNKLANMFRDNGFEDIIII